MMQSSPLCVLDDLARGDVIRVETMRPLDGRCMGVTLRGDTRSLRFYILMGQQRRVCWGVAPRDKQTRLPSVKNFSDTIGKPCPEGLRALWWSPGTQRSDRPRTDCPGHEAGRGRPPACRGK